MKYLLTCMAGLILACTVLANDPPTCGVAACGGGADICCKTKIGDTFYRTIRG